MAQKESRTLVLFAFFIFLAIAAIGVIMIISNNPSDSAVNQGAATLSSGFVDQLAQ